MSCSVVKRSDIWTSKSGANMWCFVHFDLEMCFAPQRRALFQHPNLKKWREHVVFCTFWLGNVLRATTACTFSTSQLPKVVRTWCVLHILTSKCASRHNGVHFSNIRTSKSGANMWCFVHFDLEMCFAPQRRALFRHLNFQKWSGPGVFCTFWLQNVLRATTACTFSTSQLPKVVRQWCALYILTSKCASRHNGVHFFNISTSKSGPTMVCFVHFDFEMCFAPQRRALFRHRNFQKWSDNGVFHTFWLRNVLRATTACTFSTSQLPKVVRPWCVLYILTSKCALRHNGVQLFISHLASWLRTRRFSEPTFRPSGAPNHWKNTVFRDFPTFSHISIFFLLTLSLLLFFLLIFSSLCLFPALLFICPYCRKFDFKLPSIILCNDILLYNVIYCYHLWLSPKNQYYSRSLTWGLQPPWPDNDVLQPVGTRWHRVPFAHVKQPLILRLYTKWIWQHSRNWGPQNTQCLQSTLIETWKTMFTVALLGRPWMCSWVFSCLP